MFSIGRKIIIYLSFNLSGVNQLHTHIHKESKMPELCAKCKLKKRDDNLVSCEGTCGNWYHPKCVLLSDADFKLLHIDI